ncbi:MAG: alpha-L-arabinofuranosidase [Clostridia bacterium]|nr:alpha-L-arabinofuranosidase [Clostridia bacterium]
MNKLKITKERGARFGDFYGIFIEDLNHAADGGLYAEMIRNRSFEFSPIDNPSYSGLTAWNEIQPAGTTVSLAVMDKEPANDVNRHYLVMEVITDGTAAGVQNEGFNSGLPIYADKKYNLKITAKAKDNARILVSIVSADRIRHDSRELCLDSEWKDYSITLTGRADDPSAKLCITMIQSGKVYLDFVSLFPQDTYKGRENGLRADIAKLLEELKPRFVRFPGGCLVHDGSLSKDDRNSCYRWKNTVGDIKNRPARRNNWGYNQTLGLGYYEYFLFCEDIGAEPLPVLSAGYNPHTKQAVPMDELDEWVYDALDLIEFANGGADTLWGKVRAELGHPEPFGMKYIGIGNEEVGQGFFDRYDVFHKAIREKYPDIKIINSASPFNHGGEYDRGWENARRNGSDLIDEHYYMSPSWMIANSDRYLDFSADAPKVFLGEYASWGNMYYNAAAEAVYMTGLENSAHAVGLVCYAPLLSNVQYTNWSPDMIWFDNHRVCGSANYYVQKLFMNNIPSQLLRVEKEGFDKVIPKGAETLSGAISLAADRCGAEFRNIRVTDACTGKVTRFDDIRFENGGDAELCAIESDSYSIELSARRNYGELGFKVRFAAADEANRIVWSIGGWQNQDSIIDKIEDGSGSALTQTRFSVESGITYDLKLEVNGRTITTYINGKKENEITDKRQINKELYYTAGIDDDTGEVIIKTVNINDTETSGVIDIPFMDKMEVTVTELSGYAEDDVNSLDEPERIHPKINKFAANGSFEYTFKPLGVYVFRVRSS